MVEDIISCGVLSNSIGQILPKHLLLALISEKRGSEGKASSKETKTKSSPGSLTILLLIILLFLSLLLGCQCVILLTSNP